MDIDEKYTQKQKWDDKKSRINRIIPRAYQKQLQLIKYTTVTADPKKASNIIATLKQEDQQQNQQNGKDRDNDLNPYAKQQQKHFLKRVRKVNENKIEVLICKSDHVKREALLDCLKKLDLFSEIKQQQLPKQAPLTKKQYEQWAKLWPINFIQQQISRQIAHPQQTINFFNKLATINEYSEDFYLIDSKQLKILLWESGQCEQGTINHPIMRLLRSWPVCQQFTQNPDKYYYLTGLRMLIKRQLCGMCSMALVHSRLHSIYMTQYPTQVMDNIMGCPQLNHQIIMFQIL